MHTSICFYDNYVLSFFSFYRLKNWLPYLSYHGLRRCWVWCFSRINITGCMKKDCFSLFHFQISFCNWITQNEACAMEYFVNHFEINFLINNVVFWPLCLSWWVLHFSETSLITYVSLSPMHRESPRIVNTTEK